LVVFSGISQCRIDKREKKERKHGEPKIVADLNRSKKKRNFYQQHIHLKNRSHAYTHTHKHTGVLQKDMDGLISSNKCRL